MIIIKKLEVLGKENIKESIIKACTKYERKAIIFDEDVCKKIKEARPEQLKNVIPIKGSKIVEYTSDNNIEAYAYDSVNESFCVTWKRIKDNLYLLDKMRYRNKVEKIDISYEIHGTTKFISIALLKLKKKI